MHETTRNSNGDMQVFSLIYRVLKPSFFFISVTKCIVKSRVIQLAAPTPNTACKTRSHRHANRRKWSKSRKLILPWTILRSYGWQLS